MSKITEKAKYLQGLAEGMQLEDDPKYGKVLSLIIDLLNDMADDLENVNYELEAVDEFNNDLLDDITDFSIFLESLFGEILDDDLPFEIEMSEGIIDPEDVGDEEDLFVVDCPECGNSYYASFESFDEDAVDCPICGKHYQLSPEILEKLVENHEEGE